MSILDILKEEYLFEDETAAEAINQMDVDMETAEEAIQNDGKEVINQQFTVKLINYLDSLFPSFGTFDSQILNEIRKNVDETDGKAVKKTKEKIHSIILDEKKKFLKKIQNRMERLRVIPKK